MKATKIIFLIALSLVISLTGFAQGRHGGGRHGGGGRGHGHGHKKVVVVKRSKHRPHKVVVYHPGWRPNYSYNRRWVYFPRYNFYWDNWRNHYMFWNGTVWISQGNPPPTVVNVNLSTEKNYELKEDEDDVDDVYNTNETHKTEYKPD